MSEASDSPVAPAPPVVSISELSAYDGQEVCLRGWMYGKRRGGKIIFLQLRDGSGVCQCVVEAQEAGAFESAGAATIESSVRVRGIVRKDERATGDYEISVTAFAVLHQAEEYPISRKAHGVDFLMSHRHLWLRSQRPTAIMRIRHTVIKACRDFFDDRGFTLIDTPILTPGAGEDKQSLFPVDYFGDTVFLTQTGQLYLESACMALSKVYCFGPTFRAEQSKTRRHLTEFWMIEPEVAFAQLEDVMDLAEHMVRMVLERVLEKHADELRMLGRDPDALARAGRPFARITYDDAVEMLHSDAIQTWLEDEQEKDRAMFAEQTREIEALEQRLGDTQKQWKQEQLQSELKTLRGSIRETEKRIQNRPGHMTAARDFTWGKDLGGSDETIISQQFDTPVFVTHYPKEAKAFYMKVDEKNPLVVRNMDLLAPEGYGEIIGGSQREEDIGILETRMREMDLDPADYAWYLDGRRYGSVPHGGFGLGIERTLSWICGLTHVRETIAFPRTMGRIYP